jgi:hypothetical protein
MKIQITRCLCCCAASVFGLVAVPAFGTSFSLSQSNSVAVVTTDSQAGMQSWTVDGVNQLAQQWFWYSIGSGSVSSIDTLSAGTATQIDSRHLGVSYAGPTLSASVSYLLQGGAAGSQTSDIQETIKLINTGSASMTLHFYQYSNFTMGGGTANYLQFVNSSAVDQYSPTSPNSIEVSETTDVPHADRWQGGNYLGILNLLNSGGTVSLNDTPGLGTVAIGPDNMAWAYEWDRTIAPGGSLTISKDKNIAAVPEPATLAMLGIGVLSSGILLRRRYKGRKLAR